MNSLFCIRDAGGIRRYKTYLSREQAEAEIEREEGPGCRAPFSVVEFVEATPTVRAAGKLAGACTAIWHATPGEPGSYTRAFLSVKDALDSAEVRT
jgi:hypothetical protein